MSAMDLRGKLGDPALVDGSLSDLARGVIGSEILRIAAEIRALKAKGAEICNLTVGDFDPAQFPAPSKLLDGMRDALAAGQTNYPPSDGVVALREAVASYYGKHLGLAYPVESVLITGGARPLLYGSYRTVLDPGDVAVYPVPSWNNNHYSYLCGARAIELPVRADANFFPTPDDVRPTIAEARLLLINSPLNPTGTVIDPVVLQGICELIVAENRRRERVGGKALWLCYDQVYWQLVFGDAKHAMPPAARQRMADILGHVGAWAPKPEQVAMAALLDDDAAVASYLTQQRARVRERLDRLAAGFAAMRARGTAVEVTAPQGAIYLSVRFPIPGQSNEATRRMLLDKAGFAIVPFQAFGLRDDSGWYRISVGAVSLAEIDAALPRVEAALPRR